MLFAVLDIFFDTCGKRVSAQEGKELVQSHAYKITTSSGGFMLVILLVPVKSRLIASPSLFDWPFLPWCVQLGRHDEIGLEVSL